ncbi:MAG: pro-sigmaK processing inhibitor BofA family protein [Tenericutes bacterium]|nr:pro-sigmaK processing inhibitor BofA family protein [Mycoplasmatota bacterium]
MIIDIIKRIVYSLCLLYTINIFIYKTGKTVPINFYSIAIVSLFDFLGVIVLLYLKYYY